MAVLSGYFTSLFNGYPAIALPIAVKLDLGLIVVGWVTRRA